MKIAIIITDITTGGGIERVTQNLSDQFVKSRQDVNIISCYKANETPIFPINKSVKITYLVNGEYTAKMNKVKRISLLFMAYKSLGQFLLNNRFDIIITQAFLPTFLLYLNKMKYSCPVVICEHFKYELYGRLLTSLRNHVYANTGKVVTLTKNDENKYKNVSILAETIPNMISFPIQSHTFNGKRLISVGRLHPQKGYDLLIQALPNVFKRHKDWHLDIYGEGEDRQSLQNQIDALSLNNFVFLKGYSNNIRNELANSDICIVSSRYEGFPMSITESLALGTPVVSFDCPEGPATLLANDAGILVPPEDVNALSHDICRMIESSELRERCRKNGYKNISQFTPEEVTKKWMDLLRKLTI